MYEKVMSTRTLISLTSEGFGQVGKVTINADVSKGYDGE